MWGVIWRIECVRGLIGRPGRVPDGVAAQPSMPLLSTNSVLLTARRAWRTLAMFVEGPVSVREPGRRYCCRYLGRTHARLAQNVIELRPGGWVSFPTSDSRMVGTSLCGGNENHNSIIVLAL